LFWPGVVVVKKILIFYPVPIRIFILLLP
jgi:hypothetical protein